MKNDEENSSRLDEATKILAQLEDYHDKLNVKELDYVTSLQERIEKYKNNTYVSIKQLAWLQDIAKKILR